MKFPDAMTTPPVPASSEKSRIPVMFSATGGWGLPLGVAIHTLCLHAGSGRFYDIHIVHDGMDARIIQELNRVAAPFTQVSLSFLQLPEEFRQLFQNGNKDRYSPLAYARLMAGSLFPQYGRIVYLDADVLLAGDVAELYFSDLRGAPAAAAGDGLALWSIEEGTMHPHLEYMGSYLSSPLSYCNSGVLVLDLDQMRRRNLEHRLLQQLRSRPEPFPYPDQDILNIALHGDITPLPPEWNFQFLSWTWDEERIQRLRGTEFENVPSISCGHAWKLLHMVGPEKPWRLPDAPRNHRAIPLDPVLLFLVAGSKEASRVPERTGCDFPGAGPAPQAPYPQPAMETVLLPGPYFPETPGQDQMAEESAVHS